MPRLVAQRPEIREDLRAECAAAIAAMIPADPVGFRNAYERLALHFPERDVSPAEAALVFADWRRLLGHAPAAVLDAAIDAYLMSPSRFFPTPGQLAPFVERELVKARRAARRAHEVIDRIERDDFRPGYDGSRVPGYLRTPAP